MKHTAIHPAFCSCRSCQPPQPGEGGIAAADALIIVLGAGAGLLTAGAIALVQRWAEVAAFFS